MKEMQKEQFVELVTLKLGEITGCEISVSPAIKNNGVELTALVIKREKIYIHPTIYLEPFYERYEEGEDFDIIINEMLEFEEKTKLNFDFDVSVFGYFEKIKDNIYYRVVNYRENIKMLENVPYRKLLDLVKVYHVVMNDERLGKGSILINNEHLKMWGVTDDEVEKIAILNTEMKMQPIVKNTSEFVKKHLMILFEELKKDGEIPEDAEMPDLSHIREYPMYVVSNRQGYFGASVMFYTGFLKVISDVIKDDLVIFPSSVHEFIFMSAEDAILNSDINLKEIVENVNNEVVYIEEFLSNNVYYYDRQNTKLTIYEGKER